MDYYLIDDAASMLEFASQKKYQNLNFMEKALLVEALKTNYGDLANKITLDLKQEIEIVKLNASQENKIFDTVLSLNMLKENQDDVVGQMRVEGMKLKEKIKEEVHSRMDNEL